MPRHLFTTQYRRVLSYLLLLLVNFLILNKTVDTLTFSVVPFGSRLIKKSFNPAVDMARAVDNLKIGDVPQFNRDDGKISFSAWKMQVRRMLSSSNIPAERQSAFILGALTGGSLGEILAYFGPNGPPEDIAPGDLWPIITSIFASVELTTDRDNRFAKVKLENFSSVVAFQEQFNRELALCSDAPNENFKRTALMNSIAGIAQIKFEMEKL